MRYTLSQDIWQTITDEYDTPLDEDELATAVRDEYEALTDYFGDTEQIASDWVELGCPDDRWTMLANVTILDAMISNIIHTVIGDINA